MAAINKRSNVATHFEGGITTTYGYDDIDQLTSEARTGYSATYTYDGNGNRLTKSLGGITENYSYDDGDKLQDVKVGGVTVKSYGYDSAGRTTSVVTSAGTTSLTYDYEGRITGITYPSSATNSFTYNGMDTRVGKVDSGGTKTYKRDGAGVTAPVLSDGSAAYTPGFPASKQHEHLLPRRNQEHRRAEQLIKERHRHPSLRCVWQCSQQHGLLVLPLRLRRPIWLPRGQRQRPKTPRPPLL